MKILSNIMPSIHKIYEYVGNTRLDLSNVANRVYEYRNIAIEESFDINISEKIHTYRGKDQIKKLVSLFSSATRCHGRSTQNA